MKILQVITSLRTGGAEMLVADMVPRLQTLGHEVDVAVFDGVDTPIKRRLESAGVRVVSLGRSVYSPRHIFRLARLMRDYDVIHTHNTSPQLYAAIANLCTHKPLVTTEHNTNNRRRGNPLFYLLDCWMYGRYRHIVCISDRAEELLLSYMPSCRSRVKTIYNGIDVQAFRTAKPLSGQHPEQKLLVVMIAGFRPQKDQDTLIKALSKVSDAEYELWLVGDGERRGELEQLIARLHLEQRVRLLGIRTDVPELLHTADVVVMSSHYEGLSLSSIEGMSVGRPFVASDVDGLHEMVHGAGLLFPEGDAEALAGILTRLATSPDLRREVAEACLKKAQKFDIATTVAQYNQIYQSYSKKS